MAEFDCGDLCAVNDICFCCTFCCNVCEPEAVTSKGKKQSASKTARSADDGGVAETPFLPLPPLTMTVTR